MEKNTKRRYFKRLVVISSILIAAVVVSLIIWTQTMSYKKWRLRRLVKGFRSGKVATRVENSTGGMEVSKELEYLVSLAYSDISLFRQFLSLIKEYRANEKEDEWLMYGNWRNTLFRELARRNGMRIGDILGDNAFYDRDELIELIGMLEELAATDDSELKGYVATAILSHTEMIWCVQCGVGELKEEHLKSGYMSRVRARAKQLALEWGQLEDRPLSSDIVMRILNILEKNVKNYNDSDTLQYQYYDGLFYCIVGFYYEYEPVREFLYGIMLNSDYHALGLSGASISVLWRTNDCKAVDFVVNVLLNEKFHPKIRRAATWTFGPIGYPCAGNKIDTPNKKKFFGALCKAAETDSDESVRKAAMERIELFDDPEAKAFLEKLKSRTEK